jgi:hypothetical protein
VSGLRARLEASLRRALRRETQTRAVQAPRSLREPEVFFSYVDVPPAAGEVEMAASLYPLRRVVAGDGELECGHSLGTASDIFGPRFPASRRCRQCWSAMSDEEQAAIKRQSVERAIKRRAKKIKDWQAYVASPSRPAGRG